MISQHCFSFAGAGIAEGWRSGENTRLPPLWPGFESQALLFHMDGDFLYPFFVLCSLPCYEGFFLLRFRRFSSLNNTEEPKEPFICCAMDGVVAK